MPRRHHSLSCLCRARRPTAAFLAVLAALLLAAPVPAPARGMDCAKAAAPAERMVCADPALRQADAALADAFAQALDQASDKAGLRAAQRQWLATRDACLDPACLAAAYAARTAALAGIAAAARQDALAERERLRAVLGWPKACEASYQELVSPQGRDMALPTAGVEAHALSDGRTLYLVQCDLFAYQASYTALIQDRPGGPGRLLAFPTYDREGGVTTRRTDTELVGLPTFDAAAKTLTVFAKARGVGDCGSLVTYAFPTQGDPTVVAARVRECGGSAKGSATPEQWPLVQKP